MNTQRVGLMQGPGGGEGKGGGRGGGHQAVALVVAEFWARRLHVLHFWY